MAEIEQITLLRVGTDEAVRNIQDLKDNVSALKRELGALDIGSAEYADTLSELRANQNALKDAMHVTTTAGADAQAVMKQVTEGARGLGDSYNALVHRMAELRERWRATSDEAERADLGKQINDINGRLKELDATTGNYQRYVGNYQSALQGLAGGFQATAGAASGVIGPIRSVDSTLKALAANPVGATLGIIAAALAAVTAAVKSSESGLNSLRTSMGAFQAVGDLFKNMMQGLGQAVGWVAEQINNLALKVFPRLRQGAEERKAITEEEIALQEAQRDAIRRNAEDQLEASRLRGEAAKTDQYNAQQRIEMLEEASARELAISKRNQDIAQREYDVLLRKSKLTQNSKEENDALARAYARVKDAEREYYDSTRRINSQLAAARKEMRGQIQGETADTESLLEVQAKWLDQMDKGVAARAAAREAEKKFSDEVNAAIRDDAAATADAVDAEFEAMFAEMEAAQKRAEEAAKARVRLMQTAAAGLGDILAAVSDAVAASGEQDERAQVAAKNLRIAGATVDTIAGAVGAFMQAVRSMPPPFGAITGAIQAAAVTAAGVANIAKIRATAISRTGAPGAAGTVFSAPQGVTAAAIPATTLVRGARDEQRLNTIAQPQRVYILQSDIEAADRDSRARVQESTFTGAPTPAPA